MASKDVLSYFLRGPSTLNNFNHSLDVLIVSSESFLDYILASELIVEIISYSEQQVK